MKAYIFPTPLESWWELRLDNGTIVVAIPDTHPDNGVACQSFVIPPNAPNKNGATLTGKKEGYYEQSYHGILYLNEPVEGRAMMMIDIFHLNQVPEVPVEPPIPPEPPITEPNPNADPLQIINYVYNSTLPNLSTHAGCGMFTEDCCKELHEKMHVAWGHVKKNPPQNQFNGHAVDAIMLLVPSGQTGPGIYDIIHDSVSVNARPAFNYAGPADHNLWYYPALPLGGTIRKARAIQSAKHS